ncbi:MAG TPA: hypothetical protein PLA94_09180 [Myxococcota bacterium]|nr:hypothetical protein [Myxococcota bacterium]
MLALIALLPAAPLLCLQTTQGQSCGIAWEGGTSEELYLPGRYLEGNAAGACIAEEPTIPPGSAPCRSLSSSLNGPISETAARRILWSMAGEAREVLELCELAPCSAGLRALAEPLERLQGSLDLVLVRDHFEDGTRSLVLRSADVTATLSCGGLPIGCSLQVEATGLPVGYYHGFADDTRTQVQVEAPDGVLRYRHEVEPSWLSLAVR